MQIRDGEFLIENKEMLARLAAEGLERGPMDVLPPAEKGLGVQGVFDPANHDPVKIKLLDACLRVLADPAKVLRLQYNLGDTTVSRAVCAASAYMPGVWVTLAGTGERARISLRSETELLYLVSEALAANALVRPTWIGGEISTAGALALLAILDQTRRAWLISLLRHLEPATVFSPADVRERLEESTNNDFRWLLNLTNEVLPIPAAEMQVAIEPRPALLELIEVGLVIAADEEVEYLDLSEAGLLLSEANKQAISRVALSQTGFTPDGDIAHDVIAFIRGSLDLFMVLMSGELASFASLLPGDLAILLKKTFAPPPRRPDAAWEKHKIPAGQEDQPCPDAAITEAAEEFCAAAREKRQEGSAPGPAFWYTYREGQQQGPLTPEQFDILLREGALGRGDLVWNETLADWKPLEKLFPTFP